MKNECYFLRISSGPGNPFGGRQHGGTDGYWITFFLYHVSLEFCYLNLVDPPFHLILFLKVIFTIF